MWTSSIKFSANTYSSTQIVFSPNMVGTLSTSVMHILDLESKKIPQIIFSRIEGAEITLNTTIEAIEIDVLPTGGL